MADTWTQLDKLDGKHPNGLSLAWVCLALFAAGCTEPVSYDRASFGAAKNTFDTASLDGTSFESRIGRFNPADDLLAVVQGQELILLSLDDGRRQVETIDQPVTDLVYADDHRFWLIGDDRISYWIVGNEQCSVDGLGDSPNVLDVTADQLDLVVTSYVDGGGVFGERLSIGTDCTMARGPKEQAAETAISHLGDGQSLIARAATIDAGPARRTGPVIEYRSGEEILATLPVFENQTDVSAISAMAAGDDRVFALGTGTTATHWELWTIETPRLVNTGQLSEPSDRLARFAGTGYVAAGRELIDLTSGQGQAMTGRGVIIDVTEDQSWWLIAEGGRLVLRDPKSLKPQ